MPWLLYPQERTPEGWVGTRAFLNVLREKSLVLPGFEPWIVQREVYVVVVVVVVVVVMVMVIRLKAWAWEKPCIR
jgi:hypothetical protein